MYKKNDKAIGWVLTLLVGLSVMAPFSLLAEEDQTGESTPLNAFELPEVVVVGTTPLPSLGTPLKKVPGNVQSAEGEAIYRHEALDLAKKLSGQLAGGFPNYKQLPSEPATVAGYKAHELRFSSQMAGTPKGDITIWGRCVIIPDPAGGRDGVTLLMLATNLADGLTSDKDVGVKGELPVILSSFKLGK